MSPNCEKEITILPKILSKYPSENDSTFLLSQLRCLQNQVSLLEQEVRKAMHALHQTKEHANSMVVDLEHMILQCIHQLKNKYPASLL